MPQALAFIDGKKTYVFGGLLIGLGVYQILAGHTPEGVAHILQGGTAFGVRHAIAKGNANG